MSRFLWFVAGLLIGELGSGWLMHALYLTVIALLLWGGHFPIRCAL